MNPKSGSTLGLSGNGTHSGSFVTGSSSQTIAFGGNNTFNIGAAFSGFQGYTPILAVLAIIITVLIARAVRRATDPWIVAGLVLVLGGALGNLCDRIFRSPGFLRGHVIDFVAVLGDQPTP